MQLICSFDVVNILMHCALQLLDENDATVDYSDKLQTCLSALRARLSEFQNTCTINQESVGKSEITSSRMKLPQIPMPTYGHRDGEYLTLFFQNFESTI